jgi:hypothetical protein
MRRLLIPAIVIMFLLTCISSSFGRTFWRTYVVEEITENSLILKDIYTGGTVEAKRDPASYKVGYRVRYDAVRGVLRKSQWQDYTVTEASDFSLTIEHLGGDILKFEDGFEGKYKVGDKVSYDANNEDLMLSKDLYSLDEGLIIRDKPVTESSE